jgi:pimeloyl-ACP methyl ester carboxylesterase
MSTSSTHADRSVTRVVLVHGVGLDPALFDDLVTELAPLHRVAVSRLGYRSGTTATSDLAAHVADVEAACDGPTVLVGLSGGATIALALAIHQSHTPRRNPLQVIAHEPLVGPLVADLHRAVTERAGAFAVSPGPEAAERFVEGLVGEPVWRALPTAAHEFTRRHHDTARTEVAAFTSFAPTLSDVQSIDLSLTVTVGSASPAPRHAVAELLADHAGARVVPIRAAGHLAPWEAPVAYAAVIRDVVERADADAQETP